MQEERRKISFRDKFIISKFRFWIGLLVSLLLSFSIYIFSVSLRDYLRLLTFTQNYNYLEFTANQLLFYNLFYAFLALIIGQTFFFKIVFDTNKKILEKKIQFKRKKIVHDQNILIWVFLNWFFKLSIMYGMFNMNSFGVLTNYSFSIYQHIDFYKEYKYIFILIILVLFLQSWQNMRYFSKSYFKNILISFSFISLFALIFSQINLISFESKFSALKENNLYTKHQINLPKSKYTQSLSSYFFQNQYYISQNSKIYSNKNPLSVKELIFEIKKFESYRNRGRELYIQLNIDKNTPMQFIYQVNKAILVLTNYTVAYSTYPEKLEYSINFYQDNPIGIYESRNFLENNQTIKNYVSNYENIIELKQNLKNEILIENKPYNKGTSVEYIKEKILENENYVISIELKKNAVFNDYIQLLSIAREGHFKACEIKAKREGFDEYLLYYDAESIINFHVIDVNAPSYDHITNSVEMLDVIYNEK
jgi:biopolymer transport protein ExbD